jgi:phenylpropionate dioxygenase-like ring-hydroxylating dioxygenase large terminal subunit
MTATDTRPEVFRLMPAEYYTSDEIFEREFDKVFARQWIFAAHATQLPRKGSYVKVNYAGEEIVVVRGEGDQYFAHLNVCRHRGYRLCEQEVGQVRAFVCPYHQWRYELSGSLTSVPNMKDGEYFDYRDFGLRTAQVDVWNGMVFFNLAREPLEPLEPLLAHFAQLVAPFEPLSTKVVHEKKFEIAANWKVVVENSLECYHCAGAHRTLAGVIDVPRVLLDLGAWIEADGGDEPSSGGQGAMALKPGKQTLSADGTLITEKLLGCMSAEDCAEGRASGVLIVPNLFYAGFYVDHWWTLTIRPLTATRSELVYTWLVRDDAVEGTDYDLEKLIEVGMVTSVEDIALIEKTQSGIGSRYFEPGPISERVEPALKDFAQTYLQWMGESA